jgi:ATP-binding cassette subfamily B multidrug efflux pump
LTAETHLFGFFERLLDPYPTEPVLAPPRGFFAFVWSCTEGARKSIAALILFTAMTGVFEAMLFSMLGRIVDWLGHVQPPQLWTQ